MDLGLRSLLPLLRKLELAEPQGLGEMTCCAPMRGVDTKPPLLAWVCMRCSTTELVCTKEERRLEARGSCTCTVKRARCTPSSKE